MPPPPHPAREREIIASRASIGSVRFVLISFRVSKANLDFCIHKFKSVVTKFGHWADAVSTGTVLSRVR